MIAQMYGASAQNDVINELVQREFYEVAVAQELKVAGYPRLKALKNKTIKNPSKLPLFLKFSLK